MRRVTNEKHTETLQARLNVYMTGDLGNRGHHIYSLYRKKIDVIIPDFCFMSDIITKIFDSAGVKKSIAGRLFFWFFSLDRTKKRTFEHLNLFFL